MAGPSDRKIPVLGVPERVPLCVRRGLGVVACLVVSGSAALETDPYTHRERTVADSLVVLDREVNAALDSIASSWSRGEREWRFVMAVYWRIGGPNFQDKLERWAMAAPEVERIEFKRGESLIDDFPALTGRFARIFGVGPIINLNGVYIGTDKIGHFLSQGRKFYKRYRRMGDEALAMRRSVTTEAGLFGRWATGVYSNADLVANYEGYLFYRSLFHDDIVAEKPAIFRWQDGKPVRQRRFTWAYHVNAFWDEGLNPNVYRKALLPHVEKRLLRLCDDFAQRPQSYRVPNAPELTLRYRNAGLRFNDALLPARFLAARCP